MGRIGCGKTGIDNIFFKNIISSINELTHLIVLGKPRGQLCFPELIRFYKMQDEFLTRLINEDDDFEDTNDEFDNDDAMEEEDDGMAEEKEEDADDDSMEE